jgi:hypothetical protein
MGRRPSARPLLIRSTCRISKMACLPTTITLSFLRGCSRGASFIRVSFRSSRRRPNFYFRWGDTPNLLSKLHARISVGRVLPKTMSRLAPGNGVHAARPAASLGPTGFAALGAQIPCSRLAISLLAECKMSRRDAGGWPSPPASLRFAVGILSCLFCDFPCNSPYS